VWKRLVHPNVNAFLGVAAEFPRLALVYHWAENGNITEYTKAQPDAPRSTLVLAIFIEYYQISNSVGDSC